MITKEQASELRNLIKQKMMAEQNLLGAQQSLVTYQSAVVYANDSLTKFVDSIVEPETVEPEEEIEDRPSYAVSAPRPAPRINRG